MSPPDPRLTPARPDLAARHLRGTVEAARYVDGTSRRVLWPTVPMRRTPSPEVSYVTEALFGETVTVYETTEEGWAWGQLDRDGYVGWLPAEALGPAGPGATHKVAALRTHVYPRPSIKMPPSIALPLGSRLTVASIRERFATTTEGGFVFAAHLDPLEAAEPDFVEVARRFMGTPYLWGGRTNMGLDCSGLVQTALTAAGIDCPRDSDMQEQAVGTPVPYTGGAAGLEHADLLFWPGHVGIVDGDALLHATAHYMAVVREPLEAALTRIAEASAPVRTVRRIG
ncbi:C40 family peptidase [Ancylobacter terrae]|uniref:C40 family peptidase n=1 Tax=Ancylobacter sp. sgz301288 TaxID=3342077 RepID=UPI00385AF5E7